MSFLYTGTNAGDDSIKEGACVVEHSQEGYMRIDKFLKNSRLIKRRTVAKEACEQERILVNDKVAKPGMDVKEGDVIRIQFGNSSVTVRVVKLLDSSRREDAASMYEVIE